MSVYNVVGASEHS